MSDVIDNRNQKLVDTINTILDSTHSARFAVGYFFLSGWEAELNTLVYQAYGLKVVGIALVEGQA